MILCLRAPLAQARLDHAALTGVVLPGVDLRGAFLLGADLCRANLRKAIRVQIPRPVVIAPGLRIQPHPGEQEWAVELARSAGRDDVTSSENHSAARAGSKTVERP